MHSGSLAWKWTSVLQWFKQLPLHLTGWSLIRSPCYAFILYWWYFVFFISDMTCNQRSTAHSLQSRGGFLSSFLSQSKKGPSRPTHSSGASPMQTGSMLLGKKEPTNHQVILNWKLLSLQGVNLQHGHWYKFLLPHENLNVLSCLANVCWAWMQHKNSYCFLRACGAFAGAWLLCCFFCSLF